MLSYLRWNNSSSHLGKRKKKSGVKAKIMKFGLHFGLGKHYWDRTSESKVKEGKLC